MLASGCPVKVYGALGSVGIGRSHVWDSIAAGQCTSLYLILVCTSTKNGTREAALQMCCISTALLDLLDHKDNMTNQIQSNVQV